MTKLSEMSQTATNAMSNMQATFFDPELSIIARAAGIIEELPVAARRRVLSYLMEKLAAPVHRREEG